MGRIKTKLIKRVTLQLMKEHQDQLKTDFTENKQIIKGLLDIESKKILNQIAGYATRIMKKEQ